jgi:TPR repeat protein
MNEKISQALKIYETDKSEGIDLFNWIVKDSHDTSVLMMFARMLFENDRNDEALHILSRAASEGDVESMMILGDASYRNENTEEAIVYWTMASEQNEPRAIIKLAKYYQSLDPAASEEDYTYLTEKTVQFSEKAAKLGCVTSINFLAKLKTGTEKVSEYLKAAEYGDPFGYIRAAELYFRGECVPRNPLYALELFVKSAKLCANPSLTGLGHLCAQDESYSSEKAYELYKDASYRGEVEAYRWLGDCYYKGLGTKPNQEKAVVWYQRAVDAGQDDALVCLAQATFRNHPAEARELLRRYLLKISPEIFRKMAVDNEMLDTVLSNMN